MKQEKWELLGKFGVDSGSVLIADPCYLGLSDKRWNECGKVVLADKRGGEVLMSGVAGIGVISSTGGDGSYPVYAKRNKKGGIKELKIKF